MLPMIFGAIIASVAGTTTSVFAVVVVRLHLKIKLLNRKPFNCEYCLAFWLTAAALISAIYSPYGLLIVEGLAAASTAALTAIFLTRKLKS